MPTGVTSALVTPTHAKGNDLTTGNDRPGAMAIAVGEPLYRLHNIVLNKRLIDWLEQHGPAHAGFCPKLSAAHHLFALWPFVAHADILKVPLHACLVDIHKYYDPVQHGLLCGALAGLDSQGRMLAAIQSLNASGTLSVKVGCSAGHPQNSANEYQTMLPSRSHSVHLFFDGLHKHLSGSAPAAVLLLRVGQRLPFLCYADNVVLLSQILAGL